MAFIPTFLEVERGFSTSLASIAFASVFFTGVFATPLPGAIGDRFGTVLTILGSITFAVVGLAIVLGGAAVPVVIAGVIVLAVGLTGFGQS